PIRNAQALVSGRDTAVLRRLLGYLRPYAQELGIGMAAAVVITALGLVPPWLAGFLLDRVVRPSQQGLLAAGRGSTVAGLVVGAMAAVYLVHQAAAVIRLRFLTVIGEFVARDLRAELYEHPQSPSLAFLSRQPTRRL